MNKNSFQDWVQILTGLALLIGLVLVVIEIRQSQTIALMEFTQAGYQEVFAFQRQRMGENPGPTLVKACLQPEQLTEEETLVAGAYFDYRYESIELSKLLDEIGGTGDIWRDVAHAQLQNMFSNKLGRVEYYMHKDDPKRWNPEIAEIAREVLESGDYIRCEDLYRRWKEGLAAPEPD